VVRGVEGSDAHQRGRHEAEEIGARCRAVQGRAMRGWDARGRESRGRSGDVGSDRWRWQGERTRGVGQLGTWGSVGRLDHWVQVMDLWSITLGDE
jgi:hypothetical protein